MNYPSPPSAEKPLLYPMLWLSVAFASGIAASQWCPVSWPTSFAAAALAIAGGLAFRQPKLRRTTVLAGFVALGVFAAQYDVARVADDRIKRTYDEGRVRSGDPVELEAFVVGRPEPAFEGAFVTLKATTIVHKGALLSASGSVRLFVSLRSPVQREDFDQLNLASGMRLRVACSLIREDGYLNAGVMSRRQLLDQQGVDAIATLKSPLLIEVLERPSVASPLDLVYDIRGWLIDEFLLRLSPSTAGVLTASLLGDKHFLDRDTAEVFREGGTFHVLVISGLHITFIGGLLWWMASIFTRDPRVQFVGVASVLWLYTLAVGADVPVLRASVMFTVLLLSRAIYRRGTLLNTLGLCCLLLLAWRPADLFNPSFQLTVVSVAAIVAMAFPLVEKMRAIGAWMPDSASPFPPNVPSPVRRFCETLYWNSAAWERERESQIWSARIFKSPLFGSSLTHGLRKLSVYVFEALIVSLIVQLWMLPLLIYYFHRISPISIILNLWVGVIIAFESFAAIATVAVARFSEAAAMPFAAVADALNWMLIGLPRLFIAFEWATFRVPIYAGGMKAIYLLYFVPVALATVCIYRWDPFALRGPTARVRSLGAAVAVLALAMAAVMTFHPYSAGRPDGRLTVDFLDVGQGDSAFITFPNGETMLIDGGGRFDPTRTEDEPDIFAPDRPRVGEMVVSEFLWEKGLSRIDHVVATHADADHVQGLEDVLRNFRVGRLYIGDTPASDREAVRLLEAANGRSVPVTKLNRDDHLEFGEVRIDIAWPVDPPLSSFSDNNTSLVMRVSYGTASILFTGDIEWEAEEAILSSGSDLRSDIIKVPHHGSRTSSTQAFVEAVKPSIAIVPVGRRSIFGHPHIDVVERWKNAGSRVITTGEKGTVTLQSDGASIEISTFLR